MWGGGGGDGVVCFGLEMRRKCAVMLHMGYASVMLHMGYASVMLHMGWGCMFWVGNAQDASAVAAVLVKMVCVRKRLCLCMCVGGVIFIKNNILDWERAGRLCCSGRAGEAGA